VLDALGWASALGWIAALFAWTLWGGSR
jgi:hypothetical protein